MRVELEKSIALALVTIGVTACGVSSGGQSPTSIDAHLIPGGNVPQDLSLTAEVCGSGVNVQVGLGSNPRGKTELEFWIMPTSRVNGNLQYGNHYIANGDIVIP